MPTIAQREGRLGLAVHSSFALSAQPFELRGFPLFFAAHGEEGREVSLGSEDPFLVGSVVRPPQVELGAVTVGEAGHFDGQAGIGVDDPVVAVSRMRHDVLLIAPAQIRPLLHLCSVGCAVVGGVENLAAVHIGELIKAIVEVGEHPFLVRLASAPDILIHDAAVGSGPAVDFHGQAAVNV